MNFPAPDHSVPDQKTTVTITVTYDLKSNPYDTEVLIASPWGLFLGDDARYLDLMSETMMRIDLHQARFRRESEEPLV
jgi:hypothetical protein